MSDFGTLSLAELEQMAASIGQEIRDKQVHGRFLHYRPTAAQEEWWKSDKQFVIACGPNRQGKSDFITARAIADCSGWLPTYFTDGKMPSGFPDLRGFKAMIVGENFNAAVATTIVPKLRSFLMPEMLAKPPKKNSAGVEYEWDFRSGAKLFVRSWDQRREAFESADLDRVYCDEPPEEDKWYAIRRGLVDRAGRAFFAMTPKGHITWFKDQYVDAAVDPDNPLHAYVDFFTFDFHSNCLLEGSRVSGRFTGGLKSRYAGPAVEVETENGHRLRVTVNHPVLTARGLVRAGDLREGDNLLSQKRQVVGGTLPIGHVNEQEGDDPTAEQVFEALGVYGRGTRKRRSLDLDCDERLFAGDEVDAVGLFVRPQERGLVAIARKKPSEVALVLPDAGYPRDGMLARATAPSLPRLGQVALDLAAIGSDRAPFQALRLGGAAKLDSVLPKAAHQSLRVAASFFGELRERFSSHVALDQVRQVRHFDYVGHVYDFSTEVGYFASDSVLVRNCRECSGGYVPHAELLKLEAEIPDSEKHSRVYGLFDELQGFEFTEWKEEVHVVPDFKVPHEWPMVEIVDPSIKRGFHIMRAVVDPEEDWYVVEARQILHDSFTETCNEIHAGRLRWGRQPALAIMDARGGRHRTDPVGDANRDWFYEFANHDLVYSPSATTPFEKLHDWLKPRYNPQKDRVVPKLRAFQSAADAKQKGLSWAFQRFRWDRAVMSHKQLWLQQGKDYIDLCKYLAGSGATYLGLKGQEPERFSTTDRWYLSAQDEADLRGVARTRSSKPGMPTYTFGLPRRGRLA